MLASLCFDIFSNDSTVPFLYNILTIFLVLSLLYGIGRLIKDIVEEHKY